MGDNTSRRLALAALLLTAACNDPARPTASDATAAPSVTIPASGPLDALALPQDVLLVGGAGSPGRVLGSLVALLGEGKTRSAPEASARDAALAVANLFGLTDAGALDLDEPLRLALFDPSRHDEPWLLTVAIRGQAQLLASLPADKRQLDGDDGWSWSSAGHHDFVTLIGNHAVFSREQLAPSQRDFVVKLLGAELGSEVVVRWASSHVATSLQSAAAASGDAGVVTPEGPWRSLAASVSQQLGDVVLRGSAEGDLSLHMHALARPGSELALVLQDIGTGMPTAALDLPDAALALTLRLDPERHDALSRAATAWSLQLGRTGEPSPADERYARAQVDFWKATSGEIGFAVHAVGRADARGDAYSALIGVRDGDAARAAMTTLRSRPQRDPAMAQVYRDAGMMLRFVDEAFRVGDVKADSVRVSLSDQGKTSDPPSASARTLTAMLNSNAAVTNDRALVTFGAHGEEAMRAWLEGKLKAGAPGPLADVLGSAPKGTFAAAVAFPRRLLALLPMDKRDALDGKEAAPIRVVASATSGSQPRALDITLTIPKGQVAPLAALLAALRRRF